MKKYGNERIKIEQKKERKKGQKRAKKERTNEWSNMEIKVKRMNK